MPTVNRLYMSEKSESKVLMLKANRLVMNTKRRMIMIRKIFLAAVGLLSSATAVQAGNLQLGLNDFSAEAVLTQAIVEDKQGITEVHVRGLYNSRTDTTLAEAGLDALGNLGVLDGLKFGVGGRFYVADVDHENVMAVALGGLARLEPAVLNGVGAQIRLFYAPRILSFADCDRLFETGLEVDYEIMPRARVFMGYSNTKFNTNKGNIRADESIRFGVGLGF